MTSFREVLRILATHKVEFIVVGGVSALLNGAPVNTLDLDIVHHREPENIARLLNALDELGAEYRFTGCRKLRPAESHLISKGHQLLITRFGPVDILGTIGREMSYEDLRPHSTEMLVADKLTVQVLNLSTLIEIKEFLNTEKDRAALPILRRTLLERTRESRKPDERKLH
jgi:hypothetical protein